MPVLAALYYMLPGYVANLVPPLLQKWRFLDIPLDFNQRLGKTRLLGSHKTWRGLVMGTLAGTLAFYMQQYWTPVGASLALIEYSRQPLLLGFLLALGALLGDAAKSFIKRRLGIPPGRPWIVFDQIDYVIGSLALASPLFLPTPMDLLSILAWSLVLTILVKHMGYYMGVNTVAW